MIEEAKKILEVDLFKPVHDYFERLGYEVHGEVNGCDITASKESELIIIELKRSLNIDLLIQAAKRQRLTEFVYIAIIKPGYSLYSKKWKNLCFLVRRLELGLIIVSFKDENSKVDVVINPSPFDRQKSMQVSKKKAKRLRLEIEARHGNFNLGGSTRTKLMTSYKENSIQIACYLRKYGRLSPKKLRELGTGRKTLSILSKNFNGWFERVDHGIYTLTDKGREALNDSSELADYYEKILNCPITN